MTQTVYMALKSWHQYIRIFVLWLGFSTLQTGSSYREAKENYFPKLPQHIKPKKQH